MEKSRKILYYSFGFFLLFISFACLDCLTLDEWDINGYTVKNIQCSGMVGQPDTTMKLFRENKKISPYGFQEDSCTYVFPLEKEKLLFIQKCLDSTYEKRVDKKNLDHSRITSVIVIKNSDSLRPLDSVQIGRFVKSWNDSRPNGGWRFDTKFNPDYSPHYCIQVDLNDSTRYFEANRNEISEIGSRWTFSVLEKEEDLGTHKFEEIFGF